MPSNTLFFPTALLVVLGVNTGLLGAAQPQGPHRGICPIQHLSSTREADMSWAGGALVSAPQTQVPASVDQALGGTRAGVRVEGEGRE